jgi:hypothetical protein
MFFCTQCCILKVVHKKQRRPFFWRILTLSPTALLPPPYPTALGLIGPSKKPVLITYASFNFRA